jgi:hypothetical protein
MSKARYAQWWRYVMASNLISANAFSALPDVPERVLRMQASRVIGWGCERYAA